MKNKTIFIALALMCLIGSISVAAAAKPTVSFTGTPISGYAPLSVQFASKTTGNPTSYYWVFEPQSSSDWNSHHVVTAAHTFTKPGVYTVSLTVKNSAGSAITTKTNYITVRTASVKQKASFYSPEADATLAGLTTNGILVDEPVSFIDTSTGSPTSWLWNFGDGQTSTKQNPYHTYTKLGGYTVTLTATNLLGSNTVTKTGYVLVGIGNICSPADFTASATSGAAPFTVKFTDLHDHTDPGVYYHEWDYGDGGWASVGESTGDAVNSYTYTTPGQYTVSLYQRNSGTFEALTKYQYITVTPTIQPVASFIIDKTSGKHPLTVKFTSTSTGNPDTYYWNFGDSITPTHANTITHTYSKAGTYTVSLRATNSAGSSTSKSKYITVN